MAPHSAPSGASSSRIFVAMTCVMTPESWSAAPRPNTRLSHSDSGGRYPSSLVRKSRRMRAGSRTLDGGDVPLGPAQQREGVHGLGVGDRAVLRPAAVPKERVLGPDAGVVQPGRDGVGLDGLSVLVLKDIGERAV